MDKEYYFNNHISPPKSFFNEAYRYFEIISFKKKGEVVSSSCRTRTRSPRMKKTVKWQTNTNFRNFSEIYYIQRYASTKTKIEHQTWCFQKSIKLVNGLPKETIKYDLTNLTIWTVDKQMVFKNRQLSGLGWSYDGIWSKQNYTKIFERTFLKYTKFWELSHVEPTAVSKAVKYRKILEILSNFKNQNAARQVITGWCDMRVTTEKFLKSNKRYFKHGLTTEIITNEIPAISQFYKLNDEVLAKISRGSLRARDITDVLEYELKNSIRNRKLLRYLDRMDRNLYYYQDYIRMLKEVHPDLIMDWKRQFPKNLVQEHDRLMDILTQRRQAENRIRDAKKVMELKKRNEMYSKIVQDLKQLEVQNKKYSILIPETLQEIEFEGDQLSHCVGGEFYLESHSKLKTLIMFVRKNDEREKPFFTLEMFADGSIKQLHGFGNEAKYKGKKAIAAKKIKPTITQNVEELIDSKLFEKVINKIKESI